MKILMKHGILTAATILMLAARPAFGAQGMSHGDSVTSAPVGFTATAQTADTPIVAFESSDARLAGVQFHPEVMHSEQGQEILRRWLIEIVGCSPTWTAQNIALHAEVIRDDSMLDLRQLFEKLAAFGDLRGCAAAFDGPNTGRPMV